MSSLLNDLLYLGYIYRAAPEDSAIGDIVRIMLKGVAKYYARSMPLGDNVPPALDTLSLGG